MFFVYISLKIVFFHTSIPMTMNKDNIIVVQKQMKANEIRWRGRKKGENGENQTNKNTNQNVN